MCLRRGTLLFYLSHCLRVLLRVRVRVRVRVYVCACCERECVRVCARTLCACVCVCACLCVFLIVRAYAHECVLLCVCARRCVLLPVVPRAPFSCVLLCPCLFFSKFEILLLYGAGGSTRVGPAHFDSFRNIVYFTCMRAANRLPMFTARGTRTPFSFFSSSYKLDTW